MASEDQDILAKISQLAGQINRHKNGQLPENTIRTRTQTYPSMTTCDPNRRRANLGEGFAPKNSTYRPNRGGYSSGRGHLRGARGSQMHRHRTLVLNKNGSADSSASDEQIEGSNKAPSSKSAWVMKNDRHMQLINTSVFEKDRDARSKAMEETRVQKLRLRNEREKVRFNRYLQRTNGQIPGNSTHSDGNYELSIQGIKFRVTKNGSKLVKIPGDANAAKSTPKTTLVGGIRFHRSKTGNLYRAGIKAYQKFGRVKKISEPCKKFSTTGSCPKGPRCRYIHDASRVAICKEFLQKGDCPSGESCDLSHELTPERTPTCLHFAKGNCSNANCRYSHVHVSPAALVCRPFAVYGYCEKGSTCQDRHVHECPDFSNTGTCNTKGCKLPHRYKASVMRTNATLGDPLADGENSDLSSDEDEIDSEDLDSDDLDEELFEDNGEEDLDIPNQTDYIQLK